MAKPAKKPARMQSSLAEPRADKPRPPPVPDPEQPGLACRACGCRHFTVYYTRPGPAGAIIRVRHCRHCGKPITTREAAI